MILILVTLAGSLLLSAGIVGVLTGAYDHRWAIGGFGVSTSWIQLIFGTGIFTAALLSGRRLHPTRRKGRKA